MLAGVILFFGLLSAPPVQAWIVRRLVATQPGWTVSFLKFGVTPGGMEARGMDFVMPGISAKTEPIAIRIAPLRLFSQRELRLERVEAQKLNVIFTPAQLVTAPTTGTPAPAFEGALRLLQSPFSWAIDTAQIDGQITVNDGGESVVVGDFGVQGGGVSADQPGAFTYRLAVNSALLPLAPDNRVRSTGTLRVTQTKDHGVASLTVAGELTLPHYGPLVLPAGKLTLAITATPGGEKYHAKLDCGAAGEIEFNGQLETAQAVLVGRLTFHADQSLGQGPPGRPLPRAALQGTADLVLDLNTNDLEVTLRGDLDGSEWGALMPELAVLDAFKGHLEAALTRRGGKLLLKKLAGTLQGATAPAAAQLSLVQPFDPLNPPATPLAKLELTRWPATWANPWLVANDLTLAGGEFSGRWNLRLLGGKVLQLDPLAPATLGPVNVSYPPLPPLREANFTLSPTLTLTEKAVTIRIPDLAASTPTHDRLSAVVDATYELATEHIATTGQLQATLPDWLAQPGQPAPFNLATHWAARLEGDWLHLQAFTLTAQRDAATPPCLTVQLLRPLSADIEHYTPLETPGATGDWLRFQFHDLPLDWTQRWLEPALPGYAFTGTFAAGESVLRPGVAGGFEFATVQPWRFTGLSLANGNKEPWRGELTLSPAATAKGEAYTATLGQLVARDGDGNQLSGRITAEATLADRKGRATFDLAADLPALPHSAGTFGALTVTLHAALHNENETIAAMDTFDLRVRRGEAELLSVVAPEPFVFGFSTQHMFTFSTIQPLRINTGEIPLAWLQPFSDGLTLEGRLQPAGFLLGAHLTQFQLRPVKPLQVLGFGARRGATELVRAADFFTYPGLDLTCIFVSAPKSQLAYTGTAHLTDGTIGVAGQTAVNFELALGFIGNAELILPSGIELSSRIDLAPLAKFAALQGTGLPARGTLTTRLNGDIMGEAPLESWSRLEGVPAADGKRTLPVLEVTAHGKVSKATTFAADVNVRYATTPQPTDANFDVTFNLREANLHLASGFHSKFLDVAELLALAEAFQPPLAAAPVKTATAASATARPAKGRVYKQYDTPFWSALRGYFDLDLGTVQFAPYRIDHVRGRLDLGDTDLVLSNLSGEMFAGRWGGQLRVDYKPEDKSANHWLAGDFHIEQFESARVVQTVFPNQIASLDARINVHSTLASRGNAMFELIDRAEGAFTVEGRQGVMRLTVPKQDMMATAVVFGGTVLLSPELRALGRLLRQFSEMPLDQLRISGQRTADGTVSLDEFRFDSPQARLLGYGRIPAVEDEPLMNRPLELSVELAAKDEVATILGGMSLLEKKPRADGYRPLKEKFILGGKAGQPDTRPLYDLLAKAVSGSKGTWGFLMRKMQAQVEKMKTPPPKKTAAAP